MGAERSQALQRSLPRFAGLFLVVLGLSTMGWGISRTSDLLITTGFVSAMGGAAMYWIGARYRSDAR